MIDTAALGEELAEGMAEVARVDILRLFRHQIDAIGDFLGLANQVGEASLSSFRVDGVVCGIAVGDQVALKGAAENRNGDL